ncbi:MAG: GGDEF domain-containing protein [Candidatus Woesearchaeota archaeon]
MRDINPFENPESLVMPAKARRYALVEGVQFLPEGIHAALAYSPPAAQQSIGWHFFEHAGKSPNSGLYAKKLFLDGLTRMLAERVRNGKGLVLALADFDDQKAMNTRFGHTAVDGIHNVFGKVVLDAIRLEDIAGCVGGDEYGIVLNRTNQEDALPVLERIRLRTTEAAREYLKSDVPVTLSIGAVGSFDHYGSVPIALQRRKDFVQEFAGVLMREAETLRQVAKEQGKDRIVMYSRPHS